MNLVHTSTITLFLTFLATHNAASDHYLLSCGSSSGVANTASTYDGRTWHSDFNSSFSDDFSSTITAVSTTTTTSNVPQIPFSTARIFTKNFTYTFPVSPGPKFIRLFFYPSNYGNYSSADSFLTVRANSGHLLLHNFSAYLSYSSYTFKEFYLHVSTSPLKLTFSPTTGAAFVNGIEIVSVPETLYVGPNPPKNVAQSGIQFDLSNSTALETAYRLNVGGNDISSKQDSGAMYRTWDSDENYLTGIFLGATGIGNRGLITYTAATPNYTAPLEVYDTFRWMGKVIDEEKKKVNVTWGFEVDLGFYYLLRLHWCEVTIDVNSSNYRVFDVYIDDLTAEIEADVFEWVGSNTPVYRDYLVYVDDKSSNRSRGVLLLAMHPDTQSNPRYEDIILNGVEVLKLSRADGSLDAPNPSPALSPIQPPISTTSPASPHSHTVATVIGIVAGTLILTTLLFCLWIIIRQRRRSKLSSTGASTVKSKNLLSSYKSGSTTTSGAGSSLPSDICRRFTVTQIKRATSDFTESLIVGRGGFGNVYKGTMDDNVKVAIKRLNPLSKQGAHEFTTEIQMLSKLRHVNLVSLIGFCDDAGEMILVYEYMPRGTLRDHILPLGITTPHSPLTWHTRLEICVGAARGLHYLHSGANRMIIHRDVKSTNILLDENWVAKMSDFGLSKLGPTGAEATHISTAVKGSFGYVDPEYYRRQQLTEKSDVYSFGVVLFEVLCGRPAVGARLPKEQVNVAVWGRRNHLGGTLEDIVDPSIKGEITPECLRKFGEVAESCVREQGADRPSMADVVWGLEFALQLQKEGDLGWSPVVLLGNLKDSSTHTEISSSDMTSTSSELYSGSSDLGSRTAVFSQIFNPGGR